MRDSTVLQQVGKVVLVPIHGPVTTELFDQLRSELLAHLKRAGARGVVLDLSGVEVMDADDFANLRRVVETASLMGASVVVAEMQPGVAGAIVLLDADTSWIRTARTVERAMRAVT